MILVPNSRPMRVLPLRVLKEAGFGAALVTMAVGMPLGATVAWAALAPTSFNGALREVLNVMDPVAPLLEESRLRRLDGDPGFAGFPNPVRAVGGHPGQAQSPSALASVEAR